MIYGYCRVSTKGQAKDGNSLDAQEQEILSKYSDAHIYKEAYTGTTTDRPVFNEVIQVSLISLYSIRTVSSVKPR